MLKGDCVDSLQYMIQDGMSGPNPVFVFLRYVMLRNPWGSEAPLVYSWMNASTVLINPTATRVEAMKAEMLRQI